MDVKLAEVATEHPVPEGTPGVPDGAATAVEHPVEHGMFPPFDPQHFASQLFWFALSFILLYWVIAKVAIPRIGAILAVRRGRITGDLAAAEKAKAESEAAGVAYEKALTDARNRAFAIAGKARDEAKAAADAERSRNEADLATKLAAAEARIAGIRDRAIAEVNTIAADAAAAVVAALANVEPAKAEVDAAVGAALAGRNAGGI